eukprot:GHUV01048409.1.p3 GENE.GHUV01048409.1~~GHUV01048409.1.p3  ORF type:complete len:113 (+),score=11.11 GHUV01048409.1:1294-1632(+)
MVARCLPAHHWHVPPSSLCDLFCPISLHITRPTPATYPAPAGVLWSISPRLVTFLLCYAFMGTFGTAFFFGRPLASLQQRILRLEADLRFGLVRLRWGLLLLGALHLLICML